MGGDFIILDAVPVTVGLCRKNRCQFLQCTVQYYYKKRCGGLCMSLLEILWGK